MFGMRTEEVEQLRKNYPAGTKIELFDMMGESRMPYGLMGTVHFIDDIGQIHVNWENGSRLALHAYEDSFRVIKEV